MSYFIPPRFLFTAVAAGFNVRVASESDNAWLRISFHGKELCTLLKGCSVEDSIRTIEELDVSIKRISVTLDKIEKIAAVF